MITALRDLCSAKMSLLVCRTGARVVFPPRASRCALLSPPHVPLASLRLAVCHAVCLCLPLALQLYPQTPLYCAARPCFRPRRSVLAVHWRLRLAMRGLLLLILAIGATLASKSSHHRSVFYNLEVAESIETAIDIVLRAGPVDAGTETAIHALNGYVEILLNQADAGTVHYEDIELALRHLRVRYDVSRADLDIAIAHAGQAAESYFNWLYINPATSVSDSSWLSYLGVTQALYNRMLDVAYTTPTGITHDPSRKIDPTTGRRRPGPTHTFDTADLLALALRWIRGTDDAEGLSAQWRVLPGKFGRHRDQAATLLNEVLKAMPEAAVHMPSLAVQKLYAECLARSDDDIRLSDATFATIKPIGLIDAYPISVPEFGGRYCQASFMNVKYGGHCVLNVKAVGPDGICFMANVNVPGGDSEWTAAQPIVAVLRNKSLTIEGGVLIGDSLYRVKAASDVFLAVPKIIEEVRVCSGRRIKE